MSSHPPPNDNPTDDHASLAEAREAIENLGEADLVKLQLVAGLFAQKRLRGGAVGADDLLQDAFVRTLDGRRRWRKGITIIQHLVRVMESHSGHLARKRADHGAMSLADLESEPAGTTLEAAVSLGLAEEAKALLARFADDALALRLLHYQSEGFLASEIQREMGISQTQYETITRRVRRRTAQHIFKPDL